MVFGSIVTAGYSYITTKVANGTQLTIAENKSKDIKLQDQKLANETLKAVVVRDREELEKAHIILSKVRLENSQTKSCLDKGSGVLLIDFRERYLANSERLHESHAIMAFLLSINQ